MNLYVETVKFAQVVLMAKSLAIGLYANPSPSTVLTTCGYGVRINDQSSYSLFRYEAASASNCDAENIVQGDFTDGRHVEVQRYSLSPGITFESDGSSQVNEALFVPPDPTVYLWGQGSLMSNGNVVIKTASDVRRTISLTRGGQISY
jgi:hypothetical protein